MKMSPFFGKISLLIFTLNIILGLIIVLNKIHQIHEESYNLNAEQNVRGRLRQHGDYFVWHEYISARENFLGNDSLTITTHGTYMDLHMLPELLRRWQGPISLALYVSGTDYGKTIEALYYLNACLETRTLMRRFLSIHLVFHNQHMPHRLQRFDIWQTPAPDVCKNDPPFQDANQLMTYWHLFELDYPINLLRNVARLNARTYFILALDMALIPTPNFINKFIYFTWIHSWRFADIKQPYTTVYCLPTFDQPYEAPLPGNKTELLTVLEEFHATRIIYDEVELRKMWFSAPNPKDEMFVFKRSTKMDMCVAYVSVNELEPLYDERCVKESIYMRGKNLKGQLLMSLNYNFIILDGAFLVHRNKDSWYLVKKSDSQQNDMDKLLVTLKHFYTWLIRKVPADFQQRWVFRTFYKE